MSSDKTWLDGYSQSKSNNISDINFARVPVDFRTLETLLQLPKPYWIVGIRQTDHYSAEIIIRGHDIPETPEGKQLPEWGMCFVQDEEGPQFLEFKKYDPR